MDREMIIDRRRIIMRSIRTAACLVLMLIIMALSSGTYAESGQMPAVDPVNMSENCTAVFYDNTNGLPIAESNDIAQTSEGFIWIASYAGLIRYDGNSFVRMEVPGVIGGISCLYVDSRDRLWIGTNDNGLAMISRGDVTTWDVEDGLNAVKVLDIVEDKKGSIYVGTTNGITILSPDLQMTAVSDSQISDAYVRRLTSGDDGRIYCTTNEGDMFILHDGVLMYYYDRKESAMSSITTVLADPDKPGRVYYGTQDSILYYGEPMGGHDIMKKVDISPLVNAIDLQMIGGKVWICARNGIGVIDKEGFHYLKDMPLNNSIGHVMMDYEGNLWFTSTRQGIMKLVSNRFSDIFKRYNLPETVVNTTCLYDGKFFIGTDLGLTVIEGDKVLSSMPLKTVKMASSGVSDEGGDLIEMLDGCRIRSVIKDSRGKIWISTWGSIGLLRLDPEKDELLVFNESAGLLSDHIRAVFEKSDGSMMVALTGGVNVIDGDAVTETFDKTDGIINEESLTLCEAPNGDMLIGSNGGGIYVFNKDGMRCISKEDGLASGIIMRIKHDPVRRLFWIVAGNSIAYMTEDYQVTTIKDFPYPDNFEIVENSKGDMWIISSDGIYVVTAEELIANEEIEFVHYGIANGIPCVATSNAYNELTEDGDFYISGRTGVTKVSIESPLEETNEVRQAVPYLDADGVLIYPDEKGTFTVPMSVQKLTVYGFVYNYSLTDPLVSYRLKGFEAKSVTVRSSDLDPVVYTNIPGGSYVFEMDLKDAMGRGGNLLSIPIVKEKSLYERGWFLLVLMLLAALFIAAFVRQYIDRQVVKLEKKHKEESERKRVNNELRLANQIQSGVLPHTFPPFPDRKEFDIFASMDPAREVGGDFYDFFLIDDDHLCLVIADVSGKGIPASLFMMNSKVILKTYAEVSKSPAEALERANREISSNNPMEMFVTAWIGILEISTGKLTAANAGHEFPMIGRAGKGFEKISDKHGFVIGGMENMKYTDYVLELKPGDKVFVYTDGLKEALNVNEEMFGLDRVLEVLNGDKDASPEQTLHNVRKAIEVFTEDADQFDDLTMLCMEYKGCDSKQDPEPRS